MRKRHLLVSDHWPNLGQYVLAILNAVLVPFRHVPVASSILHILLDQPGDWSHVAIRRPRGSFGMAVLARTLQHIEYRRPNLGGCHELPAGIGDSRIAERVNKCEQKEQGKDTDAPAGDSLRVPGSLLGSSVWSSAAAWQKL